MDPDNLTVEFSREPSPAASTLPGAVEVFFAPVSQGKTDFSIGLPRTVASAVCAWCNRAIAGYAGSHGICPPCASKWDGVLNEEVGV